MQATATMPTTGTARYSGQAVDIQDYTRIKRLGSSNFDVDFGAKTITGNIRMPGATINLCGNLSGNTFGGYHSVSGYYMNGYFAGSNAAELAGIYHAHAIMLLALTVL